MGVEEQVGGGLGDDARQEGDGGVAVRSRPDQPQDGVVGWLARASLWLQHVAEEELHHGEGLEAELGGDKHLGGREVHRRV